MAFYKAYPNLIWLTLLAIAMAFVESAVVVYLRELYYPSGFDFPMVSMPGKIALTEIFREIATIIMLLSMGFLAGQNSRQRFAWFLYSFAIWDLFYYAFLKVVLDWPSSWFTWDILFLVPVIWTGPVLAPVLVSLTMIILALILLYADQSPGKWKMTRPSISLVILGSMLIFLSFIWDFSAFVHRHYSLTGFLDLNTASTALNAYFPVSYKWILFVAGETAVISGILIFYYTNRKIS